MKRLSIFTITALVVAVFAVGFPQSAMAAGTTANTSVDNTVVVNWNAGAVANSATDTASFVVDRLVTFTVTNNTAVGLTVDVLPGVAGTAPDVNVIAYGVYNASNTTLDFALSALNTGDPVTSNIAIYVDGNLNRAFDATDTIAATLNDVPADTAYYVFVVGDIASSAATPEVENVDLLAQALDYATANTLLSDVGNAWQAGTVQNVLFDTAGSAGASTDGTNDGYHSARGYYRAALPILTVSKAISAVSDTRAFNSVDTKAIPGAQVRYVITIDNTGTGAATGVTVVDAIPAGTAYVTDSLYISGVQDPDDTTAPGDVTAGTLTAPLSAPLIGGASTTVGFAVQIQ